MSISSFALFGDWFRLKVRDRIGVLQVKGLDLASAADGKAMVWGELSSCKFVCLHIAITVSGHHNSIKNIDNV